MRKKTEKSVRKLPYERLAEFLEIPADQTARIPVFVIRGKREIEVEGCTGILEYEPARIVLAVGKEGDRFTVAGRGLSLEDFSRGNLFVRGEIACARFGAAADGEGEGA